jgi:hypothetical protein
MPNNADILFKAELDASGAITNLRAFKGEVGQSSQDAGSQFGFLQDHWQSLVAGFGSYVTVTAAFGAIKDSITEAMSAEDSVVRLDAALRATGYSAGLTGDQIRNMAQDMQTLTGRSHESVEAAAAILTTFTMVRGAAFEPTLKAAGDLAAMFGGDLSSMAMALGRAMENPANAALGLRRAHIVLTETEKEQIAAFVAAGDIQSADAAILKDVEARVSGLDAAMASTTSGSLEKMTTQFGVLKEAGGGVILQVTGLKTVVDFWTGSVTDAALATKVWGERLSETVGKLMDARDPLTAAIALIGGMFTESDTEKINQYKSALVLMNTAGLQGQITLLQTSIARMKDSAKAAGDDTAAIEKYRIAIGNSTAMLAAANAELEKKKIAEDAAATATDKATGFTEEQQKALDKLLQSLDPVRRATDDYNEKLKTLRGAYEAEAISEEDYRAALNTLGGELDVVRQRENDRQEALATLGQMQLGVTKYIEDAASKEAIHRGQLAATEQVLGDVNKVYTTNITLLQALNVQLDKASVTRPVVTITLQMIQQATLDAYFNEIVTYGGKILSYGFAAAVNDAFTRVDFSKDWDKTWRALAATAATLLSDTMKEALFGGAGPLSGDKGFQGILQGGWGDMTSTQKWEAAGAAFGTALSFYAQATQNRTIGVVGGMVSGAVSGAEIGSIVPGIGTAIGAVVGALVGGLIAYFSSSGAKDYFYNITAGLDTSKVLFGYGGPDTSTMQNQAKQVNEALMSTTLGFRDVLKTMKTDFTTIPAGMGAYYSGNTTDASKIMSDMLNNILPQLVLKAYTPMLTAGLTGMGVSGARAGQLMGAFDTETFAKAMSALKDFVTALVGLTDTSKLLGSTPDELRAKVNETLREGFLSGFSDVMDRVKDLTANTDKLFSSEQVANAQELVTLGQQQYNATLQYISQLEGYSKGIAKSVSDTYAGWAEQKAKEAGPTDLAAFYKDQLAALQAQLGGATSGEQVNTIMTEILKYSQSLWSLNADATGNTADYAYRAWVEGWLKTVEDTAQAKIAGWEKEAADANATLKAALDAQTLALQAATGATGTLANSAATTTTALDDLTGSATASVDALTALTYAATSAAEALLSILAPAVVTAPIAIPSRSS